MIVYWDTNCVIYLLEQNPSWSKKAKVRLTALETAGDEVGVSDLSRAECLVGPLSKGDLTILALYQAFFSDPKSHVFPVTKSVCERAAHIRATHRFKLPDALHLAAAVEHGCGLFLTGDVRLRGFPDISVEILT